MEAANIMHNLLLNSLKIHRAKTAAKYDETRKGSWPPAGQFSSTCLIFATLQIEISNFGRALSLIWGCLHSA